MALEAVVYQQALFGNRDLHNSFLDNWGYDYSNNLPQDQENIYFQDQEDDTNNGYLGCGFLESQGESCQYNDHHVSPPQLMVPSFSNEWGTPNSSSDTQPAATTPTSRQPKRRRARSRKNEEDVENQRMTHIAVERNRRKQMNEYLSVLKSLMPDSYVQRGDQASIVGGAINFVKELEQNLHCLSAQEVQMSHNPMAPGGGGELPFQEFFTFPQYSTAIRPAVGSDSNTSETRGERAYNEASSVADVEVTMVESHANLKIRLRRRRKQLLNLVSGLQGLNLSILHLNVSSADQFALYTLSVRVEDNSNMNSADEIAIAVHQLLGRIQEEASSSMS